MAEHTLWFDVSQYCRQRELSDIVFLVEGQEFPAHKVIVACQSTYFNSLLSNIWKESNQKEIALQVQCMHLVIDFWKGHLSGDHGGSPDILVQ